MIFERRHMAALAAGLWMLCGMQICAQDSTATRPESEAKPALDEVKLIAQQAALPYLTGEAPFILRESAWSGKIEAGEAKLIQVHLFKRNHYHFWMAVPDRRAVVGIDLYNGRGEKVDAERGHYPAGNVASLSAAAVETGIYYLRIYLHPGVDETQRWSVIYAYR